MKGEVCAFAFVFMDCFATFPSPHFYYFAVVAFYMDLGKCGCIAVRSNCSSKMRFGAMVQGQCLMEKCDLVKREGRTIGMLVGKICKFLGI